MYVYKGCLLMIVIIIIIVYDYNNNGSNELLFFPSSICNVKMFKRNTLTMGTSVVSFKNLSILICFRRVEALLNRLGLTMRVCVQCVRQACLCDDTDKLPTNI